MRSRPVGQSVYKGGTDSLGAWPHPHWLWGSQHRPCPPLSLLKAHGRHLVAAAPPSTLSGGCCSRWVLPGQRRCRGSPQPRAPLPELPAQGSEARGPRQFGHLRRRLSPLRVLKRSRCAGLPPAGGSPGHRPASRLRGSGRNQPLAGGQSASGPRWPLAGAGAPSPPGHMAHSLHGGCFLKARRERSPSKVNIEIFYFIVKCRHVTYNLLF